jgi:thiol-disulfide isomerase/thioredoxin
MKITRAHVSAWLVFLLIAAGPALAAGSEPLLGSTIPLPVEGKVTSFDGATTWLNTRPLTAAQLRGKVVLVNFWTYSCINSLRQLPYIRAWADKYRQQGLVVIGVHAPEFAFEGKVDNVRKALGTLDVKYAIALDDAHEIWRAFNNDYWPALYFIDAQGRIRHHVFGEGEYEKSERVIQQLLLESGAADVDHGTASVDASGVEASADWDDMKSPETYTGYDRAEGFASSEGIARDKRARYTSTEALALNQWALVGDWKVGPQATASNVAGSRIVYRFHARDLHLVMGPAKTGVNIRYRVRIDGQPPGAAHGLDVDSDGNGVISDPRMYQLIRQPTPITNHQFEIEFLDPGVETFAFTFG